MAAAFSVWRLGAATALSSAGIALLSSFIALGALFNESGFSLLQAGLFTLIGYALPGQLIAAELFANGAGIAAIAASVWFVNARLLPMTIVLMALINDDKPRTFRWSQLALSHFVAVTSWVCFLGNYQSVPIEQRRQYFAIIGALFWLGGIAATILGYYLSDFLTAEWLAALLFLNPVYFLCMMLRSLVRRRDYAAFWGGAVLLPFIHYFNTDWDIIIAGLGGGGLAYYFFELRR